MKSILEELYEGNIYPNELIISKDPEYRTLSQKLSNMIKAWEKELSGDDCKKLEDLLDLRNQISGMDAAASFIYGFKLGALIIFEVIAGKEELIRSE